MSNLAQADHGLYLRHQYTKDKPLYLDYQATTPLDKRVLDAMKPYLAEEFGNPHSRTIEVSGWRAEDATEEARQEVANLINADVKDIIFTSGATEANNLAIKGLAGFLGDKKRHIITTSIEHKCLLESCRSLMSSGFSVLLPVTRAGLVDLNTLKEAMREDTLVVSVIAVSNEVGTIQPLEKIGALCREKGVYFHTDAAQAAGKIDLDVEAMNIDLLVSLPIKFMAPRVLVPYTSGQNPRVRLESHF